MNELYTLAIIGAGLSTLSALQAGLKSERTLLIECQDGPGGFLRSVLPAPGFDGLTGLLEADALPPTLTTFFDTTAINLLPAATQGEPHTLVLRQSTGTTSIRAARVLLACGGQELTHEPAPTSETQRSGIMTPTTAHQLLQRGEAPGKQIVVYGSSRYALATAQRLAGAGLSVTLVNIAGEPHPALPSAPSSLAFVPPARLVALAGSPHLEQVTFERLGEQFSLTTDALIYAAGMQANTGWLKDSGLVLNAQGSVKVDAHYQTSIPGIYAIGTLVAPSLDHVDSLSMGKALAAQFSRETL